MSSLTDFLDGLLHEGRVVFRNRPQPVDSRDADATDLLRRVFASYRLRVAGPSIDFHDETAVAAAVFVQHACWFLISRDEPEAELERSLSGLASPRSPAGHLNADMLLRFLPQVHRRAKAHDPVDRLATVLADTLRRWPLSGILADVDDEPLTPLDFGGHRGLSMLYAERFAQHPKPAWMPSGLALEYVELVRGNGAEKS